MPDHHHILIFPPTQHLLPVTTSTPGSVFGRKRECERERERCGRERKRGRGREMKSGIKSSEGTTCRLERKAVEKNRRMHMKSLCFKLSSLIPQQHFSSDKDSLTQKDNLDEAAIYIRKLRARIEQLREKKKKEMGRCSHFDEEIKGGENTNTGGGGGGVRLPVVEVRYVGSTMDVVLICGMNNKKPVLFYKIISVLEEEGAQVTNASFSSVGDKIFYTIHSQVTCPRFGLEASRVSERIKQLVL